MSAVASVLLLFTGTSTLTQPTQPIKPEVVAVSSQVYPVDSQGVLIPWKTLLSRNPMLYELASCEGQLNPMARNDGDAKITGYPSLGILQFQPKTFLSGVKAYNAYPGATDKQILAAINDPYLQIYVARNMIADGEGHQWTCFGKLGLATKYPLWKTKSELVSKNLN